MTSSPAVTWSSYRIVPPPSQWIHFHKTVLWQPELRLLRVRWVVSASCSSLPLVCFSLLECTRHPPKGCAVARRVGKHWRETKNKEKNFRLEPVRRKFIQLCQDFQRSIWTKMWLSKCWKAHALNDFVVCKSVTSCSDVAMEIKSKHDYRWII